MTQATAPTIRKLKAQFGSSVHFVAVYILEVHPKGAPNPYMGQPYDPNDKFAITGQPLTFDERMKAAQGFTKAFDGKVFDGLFDIILVDEMTDASGLLHNPVWSTYGSTPNGGWIIGQDGKVKLGQLFFSFVGMPLMTPEGPTLEPGEKALAAAITECLNDKVGSVPGPMPLAG